MRNVGWAFFFGAVAVTVGVGCSDDGGGMDASVDADVGTDSGMDVGSDANPDARPDASPDASPDSGPGPVDGEIYIKASNTDEYDQFGWSVATSVDTIVVGASGEASAASGVDGDQTDDTMPNSGAAFVFVRSGTTWGQQAYLKASEPRSGAEFGTEVAISGDTLVVGAPTDGPGGAAYVFTRTGTTWAQEARLVLSNPDLDDTFGDAVAIDGDTLVVGARGEGSSATGIDGDETDDSAPGSGAAFVFVRSGTSWTQEAFLKASNTDAGDQFGTSVAISGDTVAVGASGEASAATGIGGDEASDTAAESGAAYVFVRAGGAWTQEAYIKASSSSAGDWFGNAITISGDTLAVGAFFQGGRAGAAYVFLRSGGSWAEEALLRASNAGASDQFSHSIALFDDTLIVGAYGEGSAATGIDGDEADDSSPESGAAYLFARSGGTWTQEAYIKPSNTGEEEHFGQSVGVSGTTLVVGAMAEDSNATGVGGDRFDSSAPWSGAAYAFDCLVEPCP